MTRAVIFVPEREPLAIWQPDCLATLDRHGWDLESVTRDWGQVVRLLDRHYLDVLVVASMTHLPPDRLPRIVSADQDGRPAPGWTPPRPHWTL